MTRSTLLTEKPSKLFFQYLFATVFANLTHAIYVLVDVLCVGVGVGSDALAALSITLPIFTIYTAIALCIGIGGGTTMAFLQGVGKEEDAKRIFTLSSVLVIGSGLLLTFIGIVFLEPVAYLFGATKELMPLIKEYLVPVNLTCVFFMYSHMLQIFLRNDGSPKLSMIASIVGSGFNIIFDVFFIFVLDLGIIGAALPTAVSPLIVIGIMCLHFKKPGNQLTWTKRFWNTRIIRMIVKNGFGVFLLELMAGLSIFLFNGVLISNYGVISVSVYAVMANIVYVAKSIYNGIAQAAQPIISANESMGHKPRAVQVTRVAAQTALVTGLVSYIVILIFPVEIMSVFTKDYGLIEYGSPYLKDYFLCLLFAGLNTVWMYYFQSTARPILSMISSICKGCVFIIIGMILLEPLMGLRGVYLVTAFAEGVTCVITYIIYKNKTKSLAIS